MKNLRFQPTKMYNFMSGPSFESDARSTVCNHEILWSIILFQTNTLFPIMNI